MKNADVITALDLMERNTAALDQMARNAAAVKRAATTIEEYASQKNCAVWIQQPDGEKIVLKSGCKIFSAEFVPFEKHE